MCLHKESRIKTSKKDIIVYKCMKMKFGNLSPIFYYGIYKLNILYSEANFKKINTSGFHSFNTINSAKKYKSENEVLIKCIIPKGSKYIDGKEDLGLKERAARRSNKIIFKEIIE